jgi:uncharacterized protein
MHKFLALLLLAGTPAFAQSTSPSSFQAHRQLVPANLLIPQPPPSAPLADWTATPSRLTLTQSAAGTTLRGWEYKSSRPAAVTILFFNGNGMTIDRSDSFYRELASLGANVLVYDYRGIGFSAGTPDVMTFRQDSLNLYDALIAERPGQPVIVYGFSLGTAMATYVAAQRKVAGLILAGTIASATDEFPVYLKAHGISAEAAASLEPAPDSVEAFNEVANIAQSTAPLLMLHGEADTLVPIAQGRQVFASPSARKKFVPLPETGHNQTAGSPQSIRAVGTFLASLSPQH